MHKQNEKFNKDIETIQKTKNTRNPGTEGNNDRTRQFNTELQQRTRSYKRKDQQTDP